MTLQQFLQILITLFVGVKSSDARHAAGAISNQFTQVSTSLADLVTRTPLDLTVTHPVVQQGWTTMVGAADVLLGLFVIIGTLQIMYSQQMGTPTLPINQFLSKAIFTVIMIHLSALIGRELLLLNNQLCDLVGANIPAFVRSVNGGKLFTPFTEGILNDVLIVLLNIGIFRLFFQAVKRMIRFNVLFVLSGPAFLTAVHPATALIFSTWMRLYVVTIFEQFVQVLTFSLGVVFLIATKQTGLTGFILAVAVLNMTAEIPVLLTRFGAATGGQGGSLGSLFNLAVKAAVLLA